MLLWLFENEEDTDSSMYGVLQRRCDIDGMNV